jgi:hypothetical protein
LLRSAKDLFWPDNFTHPYGVGCIGTSNMTRSMLHRIARSPRGAHCAGRLDNAVRVTPAMPSIVDQCFDIRLAHQFALLLHQPHLQHFGLDRDVGHVSLAAPRLPPLAPQVSQVGNAALIEREAIALPLDQAFGFEFADVSPAAVEMLR